MGFSGDLRIHFCRVVFIRSAFFNYLQEIQ